MKKKNAKNKDEQYVILPIKEFQRIMDNVGELIASMENMMDKAKIVDKGDAEKK